MERLRPNNNPRHDPRDKPGSYRPKKNLGMLLEYAPRGTIRELAEFLDVNRSAPSRWIRGIEYMSNPSVIKTALFLKTNALFLLDLTKDDTPELMESFSDDYWNAVFVRQNIIDAIDAIRKGSEDETRREALYRDAQGFYYASLGEETFPDVPPAESADSLIEDLSGITGDYRSLGELTVDCVKVALLEGLFFASEEELVSLSVFRGMATLSVREKDLYR